MATLHWLPFSIDFDGPVPGRVRDYFQPQATGSSCASLDVQEAAFRGRRLLGATLPLPPGYAAYVLPPQPPASDAPPPDSPTDGEVAAPPPPRAWQAASSFSSITYWKLDEHPAPSDGARRAVEWVDVAAVAAEHVPGTAVDGVVAEEEVVVVD